MKRTLDYSSLERAAKLVATSGPRKDGAALLRLRNRITSIIEEAGPLIEEEAALPVDPAAQLLVVDRHAWIVGNVRTLEKLFTDLELGPAGSRIVAWEGGAFVGLLARAVLGQYDPFRDQLLVVYPNLGEMAEESGLKWLLFHELTHVAQFRAAPWMADEILEAARQTLGGEGTGWGQDGLRQLRERLPEIVRWARRALQDEPSPDAGHSPILDLLPGPQREAIMRVHALVTVLEGHATHVTDLIARRVLPDYEVLSRRIEARKKRPPVVRLLEAISGIEMKRRQYVVGRSFCEAVWAQGGAAALAPAWQSATQMPTPEELTDPDRWLARVGQPASA